MEIVNVKEKKRSILGLVDNNSLIGFISLFKYDGEDRKDRWSPV